MKYILIVFGLLASQIVNAQNDWRLYGDDTTVVETSTFSIEEVEVADSVKEGSIVIISDSKIDTLVAVIDKDPPAIKGYRVEIFFGQRKDAEKVKSEFLKSFSDWPIYVVWQQPNFKVQIGDFMTKLQAEKTQQEIKGRYPNSYITITDIKVNDE